MKNSSQIKKKQNDEPQKNIEMSYKEKQRWEVIESEIANFESDIETINNKIESLDFSNPEENEIYKELNLSLSEKGKILAKMYEEWDLLSAKA